MGKIRAYSPHIRWSETEIRVIEQQYCSEAWPVLLELLPGRTKSQIQNKANALGLVRHRPPRLTPNEIRERKRLAMAAKRASDPVASRERHRQYHQQNRERRNAIAREYAAKRFFWVKAVKLRGDNRASATDLARLWKQQRGRCAITGRRLTRSAQLDHIMPRAKGGGDQISNLRWLCKEANLAKRDLTDDEFFALCGDVMRFIGERIEHINKLREAA